MTASGHVVLRAEGVTRYLDKLPIVVDASLTLDAGSGCHSSGPRVAARQPC